ncbi:MAG: metallopeptidase TldD-related protein [Alphaproteobacteria bacterium]
MITTIPDAKTLLDDLVAKALRAGADAADATLTEGIAMSLARRLGRLEGLERSEGVAVGVRLFVGKQSAHVSSTDLGKAALDEVIARSLAMARAAPEDPYSGLADPADLARSWPELDLEDPDEPAPERLTEMAAAAEDAARAVPGVTNSEGAEASWGRHRFTLVASNGFAGAGTGTTFSVSAAVLAGAGEGMERDYDYATSRFLADLPDAAAIGRNAGERAVRRLGARKVPTSKVPIVYDPRVSRGLVSHFASAIAGPAIARGTSFLKDRLNARVFAPGIRIVDDPHRRRGLRSRPFDREGVANRRRAVVEDGVLTTWLLDCRSARQLELATTGHAPGGSASNLYLEAGALSPAALMADIADGLYVTELIGMGINMVTGDYSRGAAGFRIENGALSHPVSEVTIAGNLREVFLHAAPANDLVFRYGIDAPTVRIDGMTVAGR